MDKPEILNERSVSGWEALWQLVTALLDLIGLEQRSVLLNLWGGPGSGKSAGLDHLQAELMAREDVHLLGKWTWPEQGFAPTAAEIQERLALAEEQFRSQRKVLLIDQLISITSEGKENPDAVKFEQELLVDLVQRPDLLIVVTSLHEIRQWRDPLVRRAQTSRLLAGPDRVGFVAILKQQGLPVEQAYELTLGNTKALEWLKAEPSIEETQVNVQAAEFFLEPLRAEMKDFAWAASLLNRFDREALNQVYTVAGLSDGESYFKDMERVRAMAFAGLIAYDAAEGLYYFTNHSTRRLLARSYCLAHPKRFPFIIAALGQHYRQEALPSHSLHKYIFEAIYYSVWESRISRGPEGMPFDSRAWVEQHLAGWEGMNAAKVQAAWVSGNSNQEMARELQLWLGSEVYNRVTALLQSERIISG